MGPPEMIGQVFPALFEGLESCGLKLNIKKSELFHRDAGSVDWAAGMKLSDGGTILLLGAVGSEDFVMEHYLIVSRGGRELIQGIKALESKQCAFVIVEFPI